MTTSTTTFPFEAGKVSKTIKLTTEEQEFLGQHLGRVISDLMVPPPVKGDLSSEFLYAYSKHLEKLKKIYSIVTGCDWDVGEKC
jgi:hypothetical protein